MEVHPPHNGIHSWREFLVHLIVIALGLLIALGLEAFVGRLHNRHLLHAAESNLRAELEANRKVLANDLISLDAAQKQADTNLEVLSSCKPNNQTCGQVKFYWEWNGPSSAAWDTARSNGAVSLMDYHAAQEYFDTYTQQGLVTEAASTYVRDVYGSAVPLQGNRTLSTLPPAQAEALLSRVQQTVVDLKYLRDLSESLLRDYDRISRQQ